MEEITEHYFQIKLGKKMYFYEKYKTLKDAKKSSADKYFFNTEIVEVTTTERVVFQKPANTLIKG